MVLAHDRNTSSAPIKIYALPATIDLCMQFSADFPLKWHPG